MNFERDAMNISSKVSFPTVSVRVSTALRASKAGDSEEVGRTLLFLVLKTGKGLLIAATLVRPTKLAELDA
jgi:hypothetical protein